MLDVVLSIFALVAGGLILEPLAASSRPFQYGGQKRFFCLEADRLPMREEFQSGNPS
jgi:hypothetical protein